MSPEIAARLAACGIQLAAEARDYRLFVRENCAAFVYGENVGSSGLMTENGLAFLVWREGRAFLAAKGSEVEATNEQVEQLRTFSEDLKKGFLAADKRR